MNSSLLIQQSEEIVKAKQALLGQIQASQNIDQGRFPEISRLTNAISAECNSNTKRNSKHANHKKSRIKIQVVKTC